MKGSKVEEVDGSTVAWPTLFPRYHVSDTKKAGSRGPHRHRMAFYEQLTIPSHKYKPSSIPVPSSGEMMTNPAMTSSTYHPQVQFSSNDSRYSYMHMMNVRLDGVGAGATATASMNGSSSRSTVVDLLTELQRVPSGGETLSLQHSYSSQSKLSKPNKKRKEDDYFAVSTYSSTTQASSQRGSPSNPFQHRQGFSGGRAVPKSEEVVIGKRSSACVDQTRLIRNEDSMEDDTSWASASLECETVSAIDDVLNTLNLNGRKMVVCSGDSDDIPMDFNTSEVGQERFKDQMVVAEHNDKGFNKQSTSTSRVAAPPELVHEVDNLMTVPKQNIFSRQSSQNRSTEVSEPSQPRREDSAETESSIVSINFGDVVDAFGQQEFWKAQSTIIRQQKFFSKHVFELHRVIEVQRLLAKTSSLSLTYQEALEEEKTLQEEKALEEEADNLSMPTSPFADVPEVPEIPDRCSEAKHNQNFKSGSAWQASSYATNPWTARVLSPLMYAPCPGPCSPGYAAYP